MPRAGAASLGRGDLLLPGLPVVLLPLVLLVPLPGLGLRSRLRRGRWGA